MVTRIFRTGDGRANASVTVEGNAQHRIRVTIDGEEVGPVAEDGAAPAEAAPSIGSKRTAGATAVSVQVTTASANFGTAASSVCASSSTRVVHRGGAGGPFAGVPRGR